MARNRYTEELRKVMQDRSPAPDTTRTREEIEEAIAAITHTLRGPMHNMLRLDLVEERRTLQKQLAALAA